MGAASAHVPPQNIDAEESVLGAMLVAELALTKVIDDVGLGRDDFYLEKNGTIFAAVSVLYAARKPADELTVTEALARAGKLEEAGGKLYVSELAAKVPAAGNAKHYAEIVAEKAMLRRLRGAGQEIVGSIDRRNGEDPAALHHQAEELIASARPARTAGLRVRPADLTRVRPVRWAWERRVPLANFSLLLGAEGIGKGILAAWILARATRGELAGDLEGAPARVLVIGDEDGIDSVVLPRLHVAGADLEMVDTLDEDDEQLLDIKRDAGELRALLETGRHRLVYIDALLDTLGVDVDDWRSKAIRDALRPLRRMARDLEISVLAALHPNKGQRGSFRDLVSGSHAFNASSRSSLLLAVHPDDENRRVLVRGKGNLSAAPPAFDFRVESRDLEINGHGFNLPVLADQRDSDIGIEDVIKPQRDAPVRESLADKIDALGTGEMQTRADLARALDREPSDGSVGRALSQLEDQGRWEKIGRGKWRRLAIATSREVAMCKAADSEDLFRGGSE